jgi:hypothetical protein
MKKLTSIFSFATISISAMLCMGTLSGCADKCKDQYCLNGGDCLDGDCQCPSGYYGTHCQSQSSSGGSSSGSSSGGSTSSGSSSSSGGSNACTTNISGCSSNQYSCDASAYCYDSYADCANSGTCASSGGSSSGGSTSGGSTSSGSTSSSSGGGTGQVTFYTTSDLGCGTITVTVSGHGTAVITQYYTSGISDCGANGCATFTLPAGQYYFSASCSSYSWPSTSFSVSSGGCNEAHLQ